MPTVINRIIHFFVVQKTLEKLQFLFLFPFTEYVYESVVERSNTHTNRSMYIADRTHTHGIYT